MLQSQIEQSGRERLIGLRDHLSVCAGDIGIAAGLALMAVPILIDLGRGVWRTDQGAHGPLILVLGLWLIVRQLKGLKRAETPGAPWLVAIVAILPLYVLARMTGQLWLGWIMLMLAAVVAVHELLGRAGLRALWFPLAFLALMVPPPGLVTGPAIYALNQGLASGAVDVFRAAGADVAAGGALIYLGPYELQMAEACAGMGSLASLFAIGMLYLYLRHDGDWRRCWRTVLAMVPIAILANFLRVLLLMAITLGLGDGVAQSWVHPFAGLILFGIAMLTLILVDRLLSRAPSRERKVDDAA